MHHFLINFGVRGGGSKKGSEGGGVGGVILNQLFTHFWVTVGRHTKGVFPGSEKYLLLSVPGCEVCEVYTPTVCTPPTLLSIYRVTFTLVQPVRE